MTDYLELSSLEHGRVYRVHSRNLAIGVWNSYTQGFIGIREKFKSRYLFSELEYSSNSRFGTAKAVSHDLDLIVPAPMKISETLDPVCSACGDRTYPVWIDEPKWSSGRRCVGDRHYVNSQCTLEGTHCAVSPANIDLFNCLDAIENSLGNLPVILVEI